MLLARTIETQLINHNVPSDALTKNEMVNATGVSARKLQWWDENDYLKPEYGQRGHMRLYSERQVEIIRRVEKLRAEGIGLRTAVHCASHLEWKEIIVTTHPVVRNGVLFLDRHSKPRYRRANPVLAKMRRSSYGTSGLPPNDRMTPALSRNLDAIALADPDIAKGRRHAR